MAGILAALLLAGPLAMLQSCSGAAARTSGERPVEQFTPLLMSVPDIPTAFSGSDGRIHLAYELWLNNFSDRSARVRQVQVLGDGQVLSVLDEIGIGKRLQPFGASAPASAVPPGGTGLLYIHVALPPNASAPTQLSHHVTTVFESSSPTIPAQETADSGANVALPTDAPILIGPPLAGEGYIAADSCCDSTRHVRAALPINGKLRHAQRFAVDWEQVDSQNRIYSGPKQNLSSYHIHGKAALAVADARVASTTDGFPEQIPGEYPASIDLEEADGNSVVLDLGNGKYALYAHLQPDTIQVSAGQMVRRGQVLGLVGNSGNSVAPHLHFHVMDSPSPLDANGLPYLIDAFEVTGNAPDTASFDEAEANGTPLPIRATIPPRPVKQAFPINLSLIRFRN
ncbi:MAG: M23 family metallopeptidase [Noviherbaspirillum sp.]